jgi:hypothetical protein
LGYPDADPGCSREKGIFYCKLKKVMPVGPLCPLARNLILDNGLTG